LRETCVSGDRLLTGEAVAKRKQEASKIKTGKRSLPAKCADPEVEPLNGIIFFTVSQVWEETETMSTRRRQNRQQELGGWEGNMNEAGKDKGNYLKNNHTLSRTQN